MYYNSKPDTTWKLNIPLILLTINMKVSLEG